MRIALAQILSNGNPSENLEAIREYATSAKEQNAEIVVFPEASMCAFGHDLLAIAEPLDGPWATAIRKTANDLGLVIVAGMFTPGADGLVRNTTLVSGPRIDTHYDKIHLFDAFGNKESESVQAGETPVTFEMNDTTVGLSTCYDVRFPNLYTANARAGARINIVCAAWGDGEGKAEQWDLLTRARALDSTTFVIAVGQANPSSVGQTVSGPAPAGIGNSVAISPFGAIIRTLGSEPELTVVDIDLSEVDQARAKLPVLKNAKLISHDEVRVP